MIHKSNHFSGIVWYVSRASFLEKTDESRWRSERNRPDDGADTSSGATKEILKKLLFVISTG